MEDREALRLATELQEISRSLRIQGRELPGSGASGMYRYSPQKVFMRWLLLPGGRESGVSGSFLRRRDTDWHRAGVAVRSG